MVIFVGHDSDRFNTLTELWFRWGAARVTREFCVVTLGAASTTVRRCRDGRVEEMTLGLALGDLDLIADPVRIIAVVPFGGGLSSGGQAPGHSEAIDRIQRWVEAADEVFPSVAREPLMAELMLIPGGYEAELDPSLLSRPWQRILLVAPEDRVSPTGANLLPEQPERLNPHAAHASLALAKLIGPQSDSDDSPVPRKLIQSPEGHTVLVARSYSRILDVGPVATDIGTRIFTESDVWRTPAGQDFESLDDSTTILRAAANVFLDEFESVFNVSKFSPREIEPEERLGLWAGIREFFAVLGSFIRNFPRMLWHFVVGRVHDAIAVKLEKGFAKLGDPRLVERYADRFAPTQTPEITKEKADEIPLDPDGAVNAAWSAFTTLHLGLIDGTPMPLQRLNETLKRDRFVTVEPDPRKVVPNPAAKPPDPVEGVSARACDPRALIAEFRRELVDEQDFAPSEQGENTVPARQAEALVAEGDAESQSTSEGDSTDTSQAQAEFEAEWIEPHVKTPAWIIGRRLTENLLAAKREKLEEDEIGQILEEDQKRQAAELEEREEKGKGFLKIAVRKVRLRSILLTILTAGAIFALGKYRDVFTVGAIVALSVVAWFALTTRCIQWYMRQNAGLLRSQAANWLEVQNQLDLGRTRAGDFLRLNRTYSNYLEWAEIVGWMAHRPWSRTEPEPGEITVIDQTMLPAAATLAHPRDADGFELAANIVSGKLFVPKWLTDHYLATENEVMRDWAVENGRIDPDAHVSLLPNPRLASQSPNSELRELAKRLRGGAVRTLSVTRDDSSSGLAARFLRAINDLRLDQLVQGVRTEPGATGQVSEFDNPRQYLQSIVDVSVQREVSDRNFTMVDNGESDIAADEPEMIDTTELRIKDLTAGVEVDVPLCIVVRLCEFTRQLDPKLLAVLASPNGAVEELLGGDDFAEI